MDNFSLRKPLNMAPTGIATFAKTELATDMYHVKGDIAVLGAPFDLAIQGRTGCRLGPQGIRPGSAVQLQKGWDLRFRTPGILYGRQPLESGGLRGRGLYSRRFEGHYGQPAGSRPDPPGPGHYAGGTGRGLRRGLSGTPGYGSSRSF